MELGFGCAGGREGRLGGGVNPRARRTGGRGSSYANLLFFISLSFFVVGDMMVSEGEM